MPVGQFTDREAALAAVERLLTDDASTRLLLVVGVTGQGKTRLLSHVIDQQRDRYRPIWIDLQSLVLTDLGTRDDDRLAAAVDDAALLLLRKIATLLAEQARWWRRSRVRRLAEQIGTDPMPRQVEARQDARHGGRIENSPQTIHIGGPTVDTARRAIWVGQLAAVARRVRHRRLLLMVDTCEWLYVFDAAKPATEAKPGRGLAMSSWFTGQILPPLLAAAPRLRV